MVEAWCLLYNQATGKPYCLRRVKVNKRELKKTIGKHIDLVADGSSVVAGYLMFLLFFVLAMHPVVFAGLLI